MKVRVLLDVGEPDFVDDDHAMGLTSEGYDVLVEALDDAGFTIVDGPDKVR